MAEKSAASSGIEITPAQKRGAMTRAMGETAIMSMAVSCSVAFMRPISAVIADPARLAKSSAETTGPSSRTSDSATRTPIDSCAPYFCSVSKPCRPSTMPTKRPDTTMMMSESTPLKYTSRITRRKRRKLVPEEARTTKKNRAIEPARQTFSMKLWPTRTRVRRTRSSMGRLRARLREPHVLVIGGRRIVERHRAVDLPVHELVHHGQLRGRGSASGVPSPDHAALGDEVEVVDDLQRLDDVVRDDDRGGARARRSAAG